MLIVIIVMRNFLIGTIGIMENTTVENAITICSILKYVVFANEDEKFTMLLKPLYANFAKLKTNRVSDVVKKTTHSGR
ncbi:MAG: hypothetical protein WC665_11720 [Sulfurimonas sp.]|jgi:hypothetical protein